MDAFVPVGSGLLAVRDHGGTGPPVLLLHGAGHNLAVWRDVVAAIGGRLRVVAADLRGHGWSTVGAPFTLADLAADVGRITAAMRLNDTILVGHSLGGWTALAAAAGGAHARSLVIVEGPLLGMKELFAALGLTPDDGMGDEGRLAAGVFRGDAAMWEKRLLLSGPPDSVLRAVAERARLPDANGIFSARPEPPTLRCAQRCPWQLDPAAAYAGLRIPVRILLGEQPGYRADPERFNAIRRAAVESLRHNEHVRIDWTAGGHHLPVNSPGVVAELILAVAGQ